MKKEISDVEVIKKAREEKKLVIGFNEVMRGIKDSSVKQIFVAENCPADKVESVSNEATIAEIPVKVYAGSNLDLGVICRRPHAVIVLGIK